MRRSPVRVPLEKPVTRCNDISGLFTSFTASFELREEAHVCRLEQCQRILEFLRQCLEDSYNCLSLFGPDLNFLRHVAKRELGSLAIRPQPGLQGPVSGQSRNFHFGHQKWRRRRRKTAFLREESQQCHTSGYYRGKILLKKIPKVNSPIVENSLRSSYSIF